MGTLLSLREGRVDDGGGRGATEEREVTFWPWLLGQLRAYQFVTLALFSVFALVMSASRFHVMESLRYRFLIWNLFLAWLPFGFGLGVLWAWRRGSWVWVWVCGVLWFLFFPNAPYLLTDLMHVKSKTRILWFDTLLLTTYALHGLFLGLLCLRMMHQHLAQMLPRVWCWLLLGLMMWLSGFAIYIGRFLRINSWDALLRPWQIASLLAEHIWQDGRGLRMIQVTLICFGLQLFAYILFDGGQKDVRTSY